MIWWGGYDRNHNHKQSHSQPFPPEKRSPILRLLSRCVGLTDGAIASIIPVKKEMAGLSPGDRSNGLSQLGLRSLGWGEAIGLRGWAEVR
jgi:hypothetical protein